MTAHEFLTNEGSYIHTHIDAYSDPENGPGYGGNDEYDIYEDEYDVYEGDSHVIILRRGLWVDQEQIDWDEYRFFEEIERSSRSFVKLPPL